MAIEDAGDLVGFYPMTANLFLGVDPAAKLELAVGQLRGEVAGSVEPASRLIAEAIGREASRGERGIVAVPTPDA